MQNILFSNDDLRGLQCVVLFKTKIIFVKQFFFLFITFIWTFKSSNLKFTQKYDRYLTLILKRPKNFQIKDRMHTIFN